MRTITVVTRRSKAEILREIRKLPQTAGKSKDFMTRLGMAVFEQIALNYRRKARGGTDANGLRWKSLAPYTLAMRKKREGLLFKRARVTIAGVEILRVTDRLLDSLTPGAPAEQGGVSSAVADQIFRIGDGELTLGTSVEYAVFQHEGFPPKVPARPLWAKPEEWRPAFWRPILSQAAAGMADLIQQVVH